MIDCVCTNFITPLANFSTTKYLDALYDRIHFNTHRHHEDEFISLVVTYTPMYDMTALKHGSSI